METKSAIGGGLAALAALGIAFAGFAVANADTTPAPEPSSIVTTVAPAPLQEPAPVVVTPAPEPSTSLAVVPAAPAPAPVQEPVYVAEEPAPAPVYVAPEPAPVAPAPVYVAPEPAPQQTFIATNTDAKVAVDSKGYIIGGPAPMGGGDGPGKVDLPSK